MVVYCNGDNSLLFPHQWHLSASTLAWPDVRTLLQAPTCQTGQAQTKHSTPKPNLSGTTRLPYGTGANSDMVVFTSTSYALVAISIVV